MLLWSIRSCFQRCKYYKNPPRDARVIVDNKVAPFFWTWCTNNTGDANKQIKNIANPLTTEITTDISLVHCNKDL